MRGLSLALALALAVSLALGGCAGREVRTPVMVVRAPPGARRDALATLLVRAEAHGYRPDHVSPALGRFVVRARRADLARIVFEVQCYADGRVGVSILGLVEHEPTRTVGVPGEVRRELVMLAQALGDRAAR